MILESKTEQLIKPASNDLYDLTDLFCNYFPSDFSKPFAPPTSIEMNELGNEPR